MAKDDLHAYCTDCGKKFKDEKYARTAWFQSGISGSCNLCGGVIKIFREAEAADAIAATQRKRGIHAAEPSADETPENVEGRKYDDTE